MSLIKAHQPLITMRVEFQATRLPPRPTLTMRTDLAGRLRLHSQRFSKRASREPSPFPSRGDEDAGQARDEPMSDSSLSSLSDSDGSETETPSGRIPKPAGTAGRPNSGGFNLEEVLGWEKAQFAEFTVFGNLPSL